MKKKAVFIVSLGCAKNLVDTEVMCGSLATGGFYIAEDEKYADICLINTCGFIRDAREESFEQIEWAVKWKGKSKRMIVVAGCLAQRSPEMLMERFPQIDLIVGLDDVERLPELIRRCEKEGRLQTAAKALPTYLYTEESPRLTLTPETYAYVKVAEGCDHRCSYCAIPLIRGNQRSRTIDSVLNECVQLLNQGALELNLIAQDTSRYGADLPDANLEKLLRECDELDADFWLRVLYTHPLHITDGLLDILANGKHVVPYLDIPLQHISSHILKDMKRGMDGDKTRELLNGIRRRYPQLAIRTTFLVGYPGETEQDLQELLDFIREFKFDRLGTFAFSPEEGTPAAAVTEGLVPPEVAEERRALLMEEQRKISIAKNASLVGSRMRVLLENQISNRKWEGRTTADAPEVDQIVTVTMNREIYDTTFADVVVKKPGDYGLEAVEDMAGGR
ncbi:MAG: 30S ribosomal protein S12 methylthiotransferase RimO [Victivallales bacterium]|nr:30S ribosomal protein S12 methylthiotransferase RimO [Victivallales bacterium]